MKKTTLADISAKTGWSITTISRVISGNSAKYRIPEATAKAVMAEVKNSGYKLRKSSQTPSNAKSNTVGLLLPSVSNPYFADIASVMITELSKNGYTTILIDTMEDDAMLARGVKTLLSRQVEGIIAVPCGDDGAILEMVDKEIPVVLVDRYCEESNLPYVASNNYQGGLDGTRRLISAGHKRIACIQGVVSSTPNKERVHGYLDALKEAGIKDGIIVGNAFSIQNGYLETKLLLGENELPTAIFALSNTILMGAYKAIRESGLRIPEDISLLSFDDNIYMDYLTPPIERMSQPVGDMAVLAVKILMDRIAGIPRSEKRIRLSPTIIHGGSIAAPKA